MNEDGTSMPSQIQLQSILRAQCVYFHLHALLLFCMGVSYLFSTRLVYTNSGHGLRFSDRSALSLRCTFETQPCGGRYDDLASIARGYVSLWR